MYNVVESFKTVEEKKQPITTIGANCFKCNFFERVDAVNNSELKFFKRQ